jgi:outer membrane protein insertion porin family
MKILVGRYAVIVALLLWGSGSLFAQETTAPTIKQINIEHVGPQAASDDLIRANIRVKVGDPYTSTSINNDVATLYSTGYFRNIRVTEDRATDGGVVLTYVVMGKPVLTDIQFNGNKKYSRTKLLKKVSSKIGQPIDEHKLFNDAQEILKLYQKAGYQKTKVDYENGIKVDAPTGKGTVTFEIVESPRVKIQRVEFVGAHAFAEKKLRKVIKTRKRWMFSWITGSGVLKDEQFDEDKEKLADYYREKGYIDFELTDVKFEAVSPKWMVIRFFVNEGRQYKVGSVEIKGNKLFTTEQIRRGYASKKGLKMIEGVTFTPKGLQDDVAAIQDFYGAKGYIGKGDERAIGVIANKTPNTERGTMDLVYEVEEGEPSTIEKIEIRGNTKTKDKVIRRELAVSPGEVFDMVKVNRSKTRLEQMQYFEKVDAQPESTEVPSRKNLVVGVEEKNTGNLIVGAGFSTVEQVVGFVEVYQGNFDLFKPPYFTGAGQKFRIRASVGTLLQDYQVTFIEPWFTGRKLALSVDLYHRELNYLSDYFDERETGARLGLTRALGSENFIGGVSYTIENVGLTDLQTNAPPLIAKEAGYYLVSKVGTSLAYDTRNNVMLADRGQRTEVLTEVAGGPFGGEKNFYKLELHSDWFFKGFAEGHIIQLTGRMGVVDTYGGTTSVPMFDRWFLGGMYTLRGFKYRKAGADNTFDPAAAEPIGGNSYWFGSIEYSIPIIERLRFAFFYDIGNVYKDAYDFNFGNFLDNWGVGIRLNLPIGPLRFDYGIPIHTGAFTGASGRFNFGVGWERPF